MLDDESKRGNFNSLCGLIDCIEEFADREFQQRVWIEGRGPEVSSYNEAICGVFDDHMIEDFARDRGAGCGLSHEQTEALRLFARELDAFNPGVPESEDDRAIVMRPGFEEIVELASRTVAALAPWRANHCGSWNGGLGQATF